MRLLRFVWFGVIAITAIGILAAGLAPAAADIGVGVDLAKIDIDQVLTAGEVYNLPAVGVSNTGDRTADYEVVITYMNEQKEMTPSADWFQFDPQRFNLEAATSRKISISLHIPQDAPPGQYFALIEAHPLVEGSGGTTIAIAAATKLFFSVKKGNTSDSVLNSIGDFFSDSGPYSYIGLGIIVAVMLVVLSRRFFKFRFKVERR
jgi:hypothetical protein